MSYNRPLASGPCYLYGLHDPIAKKVFYIGVTWNPKSRFADHRNDPLSSANRKFRQILAAGSTPEMWIIGVYATRIDAERFESVLIAKLPGLANGMAS